MTDLIRLVQVAHDLNLVFWDPTPDLVLRVLNMPFVSYTEDGVSIFEDIEPLIEGVRDYRAVQEAGGVVRRCHRIVARDEAGEGGLKMLIRWTDLDANDKILNASLIRYYLTRDADGGLKVDMSECMDLASAAHQHSAARH